MSKRKSFLLKSLIVAISIIMADAGIGMLMHHFYFRIHHGEQGRVTYVIDSTNDAILVLGSSRASHHYVSTIISDSLHLGCYNAGKDKQGLYYCLALLKMVLLRYNPQYVILDLTPVAFETQESGLDELSVLLPYYRQHSEIRKIVNRRSMWEWLKTYSSLYCYNSLPLQIAFNNLSNERDADAINGYIPLYTKMNSISNSSYILQQKADLTDSAIVMAFEEIINITKENGCKLAIIVSPIYFSLPRGTSSIMLAKKICDLQQVPFFDYTQSTNFIGNTPIFGDEQHLNNTGAELFSRKLCTDLIARGFIKRDF
jgi:hypothetical protein